MIEKILCNQCYAKITDEDINYYYRNNEEGEDYTVIEAGCPDCGIHYETSAWGEIENLEEAKEILQDYLLKNF